MRGTGSLVSEEQQHVAIDPRTADSAALNGGDSFLVVVRY
jgi:hypothetical protein